MSSVNSVKFVDTEHLDSTEDFCLKRFACKNEIYSYSFVVTHCSFWRCDFVWICYCRTVLLCSVTVVRTFQLCGHRKPDISSWLSYHSLWTILCYVSKSLWNLLFCPFIHSFCFLTSVDLDELHCWLHVRRGFYRWIILLRSTLLIIVKYF